MIPAILIGYVVGSLPIGYLVAQTTGIDLRRAGSGNVGATNVYRTTNLRLAIAVLIADVGKGAGAVVLAGGGRNAAAAGIAAVIGHIYPVWLGFRGGKGVATGVGVFLILAPIVVVCAGIIFVAVVWLTRYVSLGSIIAAATLPLFVWLQSVFVEQVPDLRPLLIAASVGALLIVFAHRGNIARLARGTESRL